MKTIINIVAALALTFALWGCEDDTDDGADGTGGSGGSASGGSASGGSASGGGGQTGGGASGGGGLGVPDTYDFAGRTGDGSVSYSGQTFRHALIEAMKSRIGGLTARIDNGDLIPADGDVVAELNFYYAFDDAVGADIDHGISTDPSPMQTTFGDISSGKDLRGKTAGNDEIGQHADWETDFIGWDADEVSTPEDLVRHSIARIEALAIARANGEQGTDPTGAPIEHAFVSPEGHDYQQLLQKFLLGAVAFSQGVDDYLDDDTEGKGLMADHAAVEEGKGYTALEHAWDEGFGYFGAARNYGDYTDDELAANGGRDGWSSGSHDTNGDGMIDLLTERNWGASVNAAKRDRGSADLAATDYTQQAWDAFRLGRAIIDAATGPLSEEEMEALKMARDDAVDAWDRAIAATALHYINDTLRDMASADTEDYSFSDHAKHWSELKGFALSLQFNRFSPLTKAQHQMLHDAIGIAPALPGDEGFVAYAAALREARALLGTAYGFDEALLGDEDGEGGW
jgi:hypothetical protein